MVLAINAVKDEYVTLTVHSKRTLILINRFSVDLVSAVLIASLSGSDKGHRRWGVESEANEG